MKKRIEDLLVIENKRLNEEFYTLTLQSKQGLPEIAPGQFAEVRIDGEPGVFLRRPISIYQVHPETNTLELLIKIAGKGTSHLAHIQAGSNLSLVYPLGNRFTDPKGPKVLLVGGGTGVAPMLILGNYLKKQLGVQPEFLLGYRHKGLVIEPERFEALGTVHLTTEDGSAGYKGYVTQHPVLNGNGTDYNQIYACGPEVMMKSIALKAKELGVLCEVSLENLMGCGIGACLCCVVDTVDQGNVNTCTEGPIFNSEKLKWLI